MGINEGGVIMKKCINCKNIFGRDICWFCSIDGREINHPFFMGGKKCPCYEKYVKEKRKKFQYPQKKD